MTKEGFRLNHPLKTYALPGGGALAPSASYLSADRDNVVIDTVKFAEDGRDVIVRAFEAEGKRCKAHLLLPAGVKKALLVNLMEEEEKPLELVKGGAALDFGPYELHTIKLIK